MTMTWPGNRELRNRMERALGLLGRSVSASGSGALSRNGPCSINRESASQVSPRRASVRNDYLHIEEAIRQTGGEIAKAATLLGISRTTLWEKMRRLGR